MIYRFHLVLIILLCLTPTIVLAELPHFTLHKLGQGDPSVLIIGGIQGDEPGGFSAATLLITHYEITKGAVWIVPNLNFPSIIKRSRGIHGDMNRKFQTIPSTDPEYHIIQKIQKIIRTPGLNLVLNLHDGSGFYRPQYQSELFRPDRWGQCVIIDMKEMNHTNGHLETMAKTAITDANKHLLKPEHSFHYKNTYTHMGNIEMEKSLSWFAVRNGVPAFGLEASKNFPVAIRTYYHLALVEAFLKQTGIEFKRTFPLTAQGVYSALYSDISIKFFENRIILPLDDARSYLKGSIPLPYNAAKTAKMSKPIIALYPVGKELVVQYGNRTITRFKPDWRDVDTNLTHVPVTIDGITKNVKFGEIIQVHNTFKVNKIPGYRVNAIGTNAGIDESNLSISQKMFIPSYSLDKKGTLFRIEIYKNQAIAGMFLVHFTDTPKKYISPSLARQKS